MRKEAYGNTVTAFGWMDSGKPEITSIKITGLEGEI
jgi:hypothetical protein